VGFCFGGHLAMLAATLPAIAATCDFYGARVAGFRPGAAVDAEGRMLEPAPAPTLAEVARIPGRLWCFRGDADPLIPPREVEAVAAALTQANGGVDCLSPQARHRLLMAAGAGHGYLCEARPDHRPEAAAAGWEAMLELFARSL
jgi:carboxymethylenebutenolidase